MQLGTLFVPYLEPSGNRVPKRVLYMQVQEPKKVPYITKNYSKEPNKFVKLVLKTHLEPPLKVPHVGQPKNPFSKSV